LKRKSRKTEAQAIEHDSAATYDEFKRFEGRRYTGMTIGRGHKWHYDSGVWTEKKLTPDEWEIRYNVTKRRAGRAPEGSGVPVGTRYHWYVIAHQIVTKLNANDYSTSLTGVKFKLAHKRADKETWSASDAAKRRHAIRILRSVIETLEHQAEEQAAKVIPLKPKAPAKARARRAA